MVNFATAYAMMAVNVMEFPALETTAAEDATTAAEEIHG